MGLRTPYQIKPLKKETFPLIESCLLLSVLLSLMLSFTRTECSKLKTIRGGALSFTTLVIFLLFFIVGFSQRRWDSAEQDLFLEPLQDPDVRCAVKRLFSGTPLLPRLSCRPQSVASAQRIKHSRSLGTLTSCISREL